jgi:hypothetical protein
MGKLRGSTLVETLTAGTIILVCSTLAAMIYSNVLSSQNTAQKFKASCIASALIESFVKKKDFLDASLGQDGMKINKKCGPYHGANDIIQIEVSVRAEDEKILWVQKRLVFND